MATGPFVASVSELRRRLAAFIEEVGRGEHPLFITQHGCITAVLISRELYHSWRPESERRDGGGGRERVSRDRGAPPTRRSTRSSVLPERRVWTQYGWCDFVVAQVLAEQGVDTELILTEEGWMTDDEG